MFYKFLNKILFFNYRMVKSPISFLQEFAIKQGYVPMYDFKIMNTINNSNHFSCRVVCKDLSAVGTGNSKKQAKQKAAENMLLLLGQTNQVSMSSIISPLTTDADQTQKTIISNAPSSSIHWQLISEMKDIKKDIKNIKAPLWNSCINYIGDLQVSSIKHDFSVMVEIIQCLFDA